MRGAGFSSALVVAIVAGWRRRWRLAGTRRRRGFAARMSLGALVAVAVVMLALSANAAEPMSPMETDTSPQDTNDVGPDEPFPFGVHLAGSGALQNTAIAGSLGFRYRLSEHWLVGVDGEYNPWIVRRTGEIRAGATNIYATGILRFPMKNERINLRSTLHLGVSRMNFDLFGVPKGSVGPYVGFNILGLDIELTRSLYLVIDPADIAFPIPQLEGVVYTYPQYRVTLGLQLGG